MLRRIVPLMDNGLRNYLREAAKGTLLFLPGMVGDYGQTYVTDYSGNSNDCSLSGSTWATGPKGYPVINCDGTDDWGNAGAGASINVTNNFSVAIWAKVTLPDSDYETIFAKWDTNALRSWTIQCAADPNRGTVNFAISADGGTVNWKSYTTSAAYFDGTYRLYGFTFASNVLTPYINGSAIACSKDVDSAVNTVYQSAVNTTIGGEYVLGTIGRHAIMQWRLARIYNRALSATDSLSLYQRERVYFGV